MYSEQIFIGSGSGIHKQLVAEELSHHNAHPAASIFHLFPLCGIGAVHLDELMF